MSRMLSCFAIQATTQTGTQQRFMDRGDSSCSSDTDFRGAVIDRTTLSSVLCVQAISQRRQTWFQSSSFAMSIGRQHHIIRNEYISSGRHVGRKTLTTNSDCAVQCISCHTHRHKDTAERLAKLNVLHTAGSSP